MNIARLTTREVGTHGFAKDPVCEALAGPIKRRVRGRAAQSVFGAFLLAAASIRKIGVFAANARENAGGANYVPRTPAARANMLAPACRRAWNT